MFTEIFWIRRVVKIRVEKVKRTTIWYNLERMEYLRLAFENTIQNWSNFTVHTSFDE